MHHPPSSPTRRPLRVAVPSPRPRVSPGARTYRGMRPHSPTPERATRARVIVRTLENALLHRRLSVPLDGAQHETRANIAVLRDEGEYERHGVRLPHPLQKKNPDPRAHHGSPRLASASSATPGGGRWEEGSKKFGGGSCTRSVHAECVVFRQSRPRTPGAGCAARARGSSASPESGCASSSPCGSRSRARRVRARCRGRD